MRENWPFGELKPAHYGLIMTDCPWRFKTYSQKGKEKKSAELHYDTMSLEDIKALPVGDLADPKGSFLWHWATRPMWEAAWETMQAWGFEYVTQGTWVKTTKDGKGLAFGTGYVLRDCSEPFIIGKIGKPKVVSRSVRSVIRSPRREHSRKPDEAYTAAGLLVGDVPKADLFSRQSRPGWDNWGAESNKFDPSSAIAGILGAAA